MIHLHSLPDRRVAEGIQYLLPLTLHAASLDYLKCTREHMDSFELFVNLLKLGPRQKKIANPRVSISLEVHEGRPDGLYRDPPVLRNFDKPHAVSSQRDFLRPALLHLLLH